MKTTNEKPALNATKLDLENVILTPRRKSKKRSNATSPSPHLAVKKPGVGKRRKYIKEPNLVLTPEAAAVVKDDMLNFGQIKQTKETEAQFITNQLELKTPSKELFVALLYNLQIVEV